MIANLRASLPIFVLISLTATAALADSYLLKFSDSFAPAPGVVSCILLEVGVDKLLLEDGSGCIALES